MNAFELTLSDEMGAYDLALSDDVRRRLAEYFALLTKWNERLHLVAPCSPEEFATRHVLESLMLLHHLPNDAVVVDVGSGGGLPLIPCLIARPDLQGTMIESSQKKSVFLNEVLRRLNLARRGKVITQRFQDVREVRADFVTSRALEHLTELIPTLIAWAPPKSTLLIFGGEALGNFRRELLPNSERRFLYVIPTAETQS